MNKIPFNHILTYLKQMGIARFGETKYIFGGGVIPNNVIYQKYFHFLAGTPVSTLFGPIRYFHKMLVVNELRSLVTTGECDVKLLESVLEADKFFWYAGTTNVNTHETKLLN